MTSISEKFVKKEMAIQEASDKVTKMLQKWEDAPENDRAHWKDLAAAWINREKALKTDLALLRYQIPTASSSAMVSENGTQVYTTCGIVAPGAGGEASCLNGVHVPSYIQVEGPHSCSWGGALQGHKCCRKCKTDLASLFGKDDGRCKNQGHCTCPANIINVRNPHCARCGKMF